MSWQSVVLSLAQTVVKVVGGGPSAPAAPVAAAPPGVSSITAAGLNAFVQIAGPIVRIVEGKGTIADDEDAANAVMDAVALIDPAATPIVDLVQDAEPVFGFVVEGFKNGTITPGQTPIVGGIDGARGHIHP